MGVGLYYCGKNMNKDYKIISDVVIKPTEKDLTQYKNANIVKQDTININNAIIKEENRIKTKDFQENEISALSKPTENIMPTCIYSTKFPQKLNINNLLFWNASSDSYIYWSYREKTDSIIILTYLSQISNINIADNISINRDQPIILSYQSYAGHNNGKIVTYGEKTFPPYWYMNWKIPSSEEKFEPIFQPCLGSLYTYNNNDLTQFFVDHNTIYACNFKAYDNEKNLLAIDNVPFTRINDEHYLSFIKNGSKNVIYRLALIKCKANSKEFWSIMYSKNISIVNSDKFCTNKSFWLLFNKKPILTSLEQGDWQSRIENDKFEPSSGLIQNKTCYSNWWTTYGGVPSKQYVPSV